MKEIERKYLVKQHVAFLANGMHIMQGYLSKGNLTTRVRIAGDDAFLTLKGPKVWLTNDEFEYNIPLSHAKELLRKYAFSKVEKMRYEIPYEGLTLEVDEFYGALDGLILAEVQLPSEDYEFNPPDWFGAEVTEDFAYANVNLAESTYSKATKTVERINS